MIVKLSAEEIVSMWRTEVKRAVGLKRAQELKETAMYSVGVNECTGMAFYEMRLLMKEYHEIQTILEDIESHLEELVLTIPGAAKLLEIKGIGTKTAAGFLAEIGDINRFTHPKQIIKLAGLNLRENSSGDHKGMTTITKRGRSRLRAILFRAMLPLVAKNAEFNALHKHYTGRNENPLKKKQSLIALCGRFIRIAYTLVTRNVEYDPAKVLGGLVLTDAPIAA
jgi:transposase